jgi:ADP-ribosylglycohydrolase
LPFDTSSIEELPVALAVLSYGRGDFVRTLRAAVLYGRDNDSIAGKACGLLGAMHGTGIIPESLRTASNQANKRDFAAQAEEFTGVVRAIQEKDQARWNARTAAIRAE